MTEITKNDLIAASALVHLNIIQPKDEMVVAEYFAIHRKFGYGRGRKDENAAVVAWCRNVNMDWCGCADAIEAGEHLQ